MNVQPYTLWPWLKKYKIQCLHLQRHLLHKVYFVLNLTSPPKPFGVSSTPKAPTTKSLSTWNQWKTHNSWMNSYTWILYGKKRSHKLFFGDKTVKSWVKFGETPRKVNKKNIIISLHKIETYIKIEKTFHLPHISWQCDEKYRNISNTLFWQKVWQKLEKCFTNNGKHYYKWLRYTKIWGVCLWW